MSDKYTYADIIIDPKDPRLEGAIGKECYSGDTFLSTLKFANENINCSRLTHISPFNIDAPFSTDYAKDILSSYDCSFIILKKEIKQKYVPFDLSKKEIKDKLRGQWIAKKESLSEFMITGFGYEFEPFVNINDTHLSAIQLFEKFTFLDGTPCGELVVEEEA